MKNKKLFKTVLAATLASTMLVGCGNGGSNAGSSNGNDSSNQQESQSSSGDETVTLRLFSNLPDRKTGQGLVEQMIIDKYMKENKNVKIEVEALDEEAYKTKFKAYSMEGMPDVVSIWGQPAFLDEVVDAGVLEPLNQDDYADYKFVEGSLDGYTYDGKLYGLPRNTDVACIFYNQKMFEDNNWEIPKTYDELVSLAGDIKSKDIIPMAMDGGYISQIYFISLLEMIIRNL